MSNTVQQRFIEAVALEVVSSTSIVMRVHRRELAGHNYLSLLKSFHEDIAAHDQSKSSAHASTSTHLHTCESLGLCWQGRLYGISDDPSNWAKLELHIAADHVEVAKISMASSGAVRAPSAIYFRAGLSSTVLRRNFIELMGAQTYQSCNNGLGGNPKQCLKSSLVDDPPSS